MTKPTMPTEPRSPKTSNSVRVAVYTRVGSHRDAYLLRIQEAAIDAFLASGKIRDCVRVDEVYRGVGLEGELANNQPPCENKRNCPACEQSAKAQATASTPRKALCTRPELRPRQRSLLQCVAADTRRDDRLSGCGPSQPASTG